MKRVIKFWSHYENDTKNGVFSDCSTKYDILPIVVEDNAAQADLKRIAKDLGLKTIGSAKKTKIKEGYRRYNTDITHFIKLNETKPGSKWDNKTMQVCLGFITIKDIGLPIKKRANSKVTEEHAMDLRDAQEIGRASCRER